MIRFTRNGRVRIQQTREPLHPFWQTTTISPYSPDVRSTPLGIDFTRLKAASKATIDVSVPVSLPSVDFDRLPSPILIDAHGPEETIYRAGDRVLHELPSDVRPIVLLSADGDLPRSLAAASPLLAIAAWPLDLTALESIARKAKAEGCDWGFLVPVIFPITTSLDTLRSIADIAE
ncbi:MAG: hypothetical protein R3338_15800, partial [Thermoanaerobaculia bacterium]|nr:hypothetical protein [Thermoanaerobaculia bacterium]